MGAYETPATLIVQSGTYALSSAGPTITVKFNQDVHPPTTTTLLLTNIETHQQTYFAVKSVSYDASTHIATFEIGRAHV